MAIIEKFTISDFKGIKNVSIELSDRSNCPVITLIGLNESGKTTILEALSHFVSGDKSVAELFDGVHSKTYGPALIPVHKKAAFSSEIKISARIKLDETDIENIKKVSKETGIDIDIDQIIQPFDIIRSYKFIDSVLDKTSNSWHFSLLTRNSKKSSYKKYQRPTESENDLWNKIHIEINERLPQIVYFPTFLVDMPSKIYLKEHDGEKAINRHYRIVFQDILDSLGEGLSLDRHVCKRIADFKESQNTPTWLSMLIGGQSKAPIDSVFQKISNAVTQQVLGSWQRVFQRAISAKSIFVEWHIDTEKNDLPYASFHISDGESRYAISERSLGFRWFFSFLLFTAFKQGKSKSTIFIFDEPAANLHAKAQAELLTSFSKIASDGNKIIYSTHSHHMINPHWLSGAYIIENTAIDYDTSDSFGLNAKPTDIKASKYREFLSKYPSRSSYFQPVIEKLEYVSPEIIGTTPFVIVEGISDYYALRIAQRLTNTTMAYSLIPGVGSGASGPMISQMMGRGESFAILLDDDHAGNREAERYKSEWYLSETQVFTLKVIDPNFKGMSLEGLLGDETKTKIKETLGIEDKLSKKQVGWHLAELCAIEKMPSDAIPESALSRLNIVLEFLNKRFL